MSQHESILGQSVATHDAVGAGDRGGDAGRSSTGRIDQSKGDAAVSDGVEPPTN
jgi:hypothetical protein